MSTLFKVDMLPGGREDAQTYQSKIDNVTSIIKTTVKPVLISSRISFADIPWRMFRHTREARHLDYYLVSSLRFLPPVANDTCDAGAFLGHHCHSSTTTSGVSASSQFFSTLSPLGRLWDAPIGRRDGPAIYNGQAIES